MRLIQRFDYYFCPKIPNALYASLLFAVVFFYARAVHQQEALNTQDSITIYWDFDLVDPLETPTLLLTEIQNAVIETLSDVGVTPYYGIEPDYDISIGLFGDQRILITIDPRTTGDTLPQSSVLFAHPNFDLMHRSAYYEIAFIFQSENNAVVEAARNFLIGMSLYSIDRCDLAERFFEQAQNHASDLLFAWEVNPQVLQRDQSDTVAFYRGNCALMLGSYTNAEMHFEQALLAQDDEINFSPAVNLAWTYIQLGRPDDAFSLMNRLLNSQTYDVMRLQTLQSRSQLYALAFRYDEAIADMDAAIALDPDNSLLYVERGQRILLLYEWDRALADFNHALELDPDDANAYYFRGILYASVPEGVEASQLALADFQRYLELAPNGQHVASAAENIASLQAQLAALDS